MKFTRLQSILLFLAVIASGILAFSFFKNNNATSLPHEVTLEDYLYYDGNSVSSIRNVWIPHYHRHKKFNEAEHVLKLLIRKRKLTTAERYFFDLLYKDTDFYTNYENLILNYLKGCTKDEADVLTSSPSATEIMRARYAYTGEMSYIDEYMQLLVHPETNEDEQTYIKESLAELSRIYHPLYMHISEKARSKKPGLDIKLLPVYNFVKNVAYKPSTTLRKEAKNHLAAGDIKEAMISLRTSHDYFPDNPYTYFTLGRVLIKENNPQAAIDAFKISNWLYEGHNDKAVCYYIAQTYDQIGDLENAIKYYQKAININPDYESAIVNIAWALMRAGRKEETIKYALRTIEVSSDSKNIAWAREVLEELEADVSIANRKQEEIKNDLQNLFDTEQFVKMEEQLAKADSLKTVNEDGRLLIYSLYEEFIPSNTGQSWQFERILPKITKWVTENPDSHFANATAGMFYIKYAWNARGTGYSSSITEKSSELFRKRMMMAGEYLIKAYNILPTDSSVPCNMITVARITPQATDNKSIDDWYKLAVTAYKDDPGPHKLRLHFLAPEWGGSHEQQFEFARSVVAKLSYTSSASQMIPAIHWRVYEKSNDRNYFKNPDIWSEVSQIYSKLVKEYPDSMKFHNEYAKVAYFADHLDIAKQEFEVIGNNWDKTVWYSNADFKKIRDNVL